MKCSMCGEELSPDSQTCPSCGAPVSAAVVSPPQSHIQAPAQQTPVRSALSSQAPAADSQKAQIALGLGVASLIVSVLAGIPAIILGYLAKDEIRKSEGRLKGDSLATIGMVLGGVSVGLTLLVVFIVASYFL